MAKIRVGLVFGGKSGEHEVSIRSAKSIYESLDKSKYEVVLLGVDKKGLWHRIDQKWLPEGPEMKSLPGGDKGITVQEEKADVFFPIIHGTFGEDGCVQGLFELMDTAYVGAGVLGSAVGMDKEIQKKLLKYAGIQTADFKVIKSLGDLKNIKIKKYPVFVKPANMGSSVGIGMCNNKGELEKAVKEAFLYDIKVLVEEEVVGREIEISVLGNFNPVASLPGEVIPKGHSFYDYEAKYIDENGAELLIPAKLPKSKIKEIQKLAVKTFITLECAGMARVDMFLKPDGKLIVNEINTIPGFTSISMYPKLWEATGLTYSKLLDRLIDLALDKKREKDKLKRDFRKV
jgi:D-alanine-D-alanine ligase